VGKALRPLLPDARFARRAELDITDASAVRTAAEGVDLIVHLAANTYVDRCEEDPEEAHRINASGTANVVSAARSVGARVLYLSTDFVFSGLEHGEYGEDDDTRPVNEYGRSKLAGEGYLAAEDVIVRSSWIFGEGRNFIRTILELASQGPLSVVDDQRGRPTGAADLAQALVFLITTEFQGTIHIAGDGEPCTWAELARTALREAGIEQTVEPIDSAAYEANAGRVVAPRPANSTLSLDKARSLGAPLVHWRASVSRYVRGLE
jgi:dTDP-4-dehydrorhamnose 3,5-epimerase